MFRPKKANHTDPAVQPAAANAPATPSTDPTAAPQAAAETGTGPAPSPADLEALKKAAAESAEWKDKCLRIAADLDNYRKRAAREKIETTKYATQQLLTRLLPTVDTFETALQHAEQAGAETTVKSLIDGLKMTLGQLHAVLREAGVETVNAEGQPFDPQVHEAVSHLESDTHPAGKVIQQLRKGYKLSDRLLRPATVVVSKGKAEATDAAANQSTNQPSVS